MIKISSLIVILSFIACLSPLAINAHQALTVDEQVSVKEPNNLVKFKTEDEMLLAGYYSPGLENRPGVLLLHDCAHDGSSYQQLASRLAELGFHAFALDLRGYGYSANVIYSHDIIKKQAKDIMAYQSEVVRITSYWELDILAAFKYLLARIGPEQSISVVASGCTAPQAVFLAEKIRVKSFVMITPTFNYMEKEKYKNLIDIPIYFVNSAHHIDSYHTAKELFEWNGDTNSNFLVLKGSRFGHALINSNPYLADNIALWLNEVTQN